jgi:hypothetical protein
VSDANGINGSGQFASTVVAHQQAAQAAQLQGAQNASVHQALIGVPGVKVVAVPPRTADDPLVLPKKAPNPMVPVRNQNGGTSPLATAPLANTAAGATNLSDGPPGQPVEEIATKSGQASSELLPQSNGLIAFGRTTTGASVYLEAERYYSHIRPLHITNPPDAHDKTTRTWWPVVYASTGQGPALA